MRNFWVMLGIVNISVGIFLSLILVVLQGIFLFPLGVIFIIFGAGICRGKIFSKLLFFGIIPVSILFLLMVIMLGVSNDVPEYYKTPPLIQIGVMLPILFIIIADVILTHGEKYGRKNKKSY